MLSTSDVISLRVPKNYRVRYTWGRGSWSYTYYERYEQAVAGVDGGMSKPALTVFGREYTRVAIRAVIEHYTRSKWRRVEAKGTK